MQSPGMYIIEVTDSYTGWHTDTVGIKSDVQKPIANILNSDTLNCRNATVQINGVGSSVGIGCNIIGQVPMEIFYQIQNN
jgi:hypothetical protein